LVCFAAGRNLPNDDPRRRRVDAIKLLKQDHDAVEEQFKRFEKAGSKAYKTKRQIADRVIEELSVHAAIEELILYPAMEKLGGEFQEMVEEANVEHAEAKNALRALEGLSGEDPLLDAKMSALIGGVRHHVKEEEEEMLPKLRREMSPSDLEELGERLKEAKKTAPTRPE
jgi:hemerythrin-like domain-containing protein